MPKILDIEMAFFDLEDYLLLSIHPSCKKYLKFQWQDIIYEFRFFHLVWF